VIIAIVGATMVGKTEASFHAAHELDGVVVCGDQAMAD
jgi:tRNA A37 N6-isopentenylltransferase MiaA